MSEIRPASDKCTYQSGTYVSLNCRLASNTEEEEEDPVEEMKLGVFNEGNGLFLSLNFTRRRVKLSTTCFRKPISDTVKYFTEMCSGSEAGSYFRLKDFVYHSRLGLRVIEKKKTIQVHNVI